MLTSSQFRWGGINVILRAWFVVTTLWLLIIFCGHLKRRALVQTTLSECIVLKKSLSLTNNIKTVLSTAWDFMNCRTGLLILHWWQHVKKIIFKWPPTWLKREPMPITIARLLITIYSYISMFFSVLPLKQLVVVQVHDFSLISTACTNMHSQIVIIFIDNWN